jgi:hypothetical protein
MRSFSVVEDFDVLEDLAPGTGARLEDLVPNELLLRVAKKLSATALS